MKKKHKIKRVLVATRHLLAKDLNVAEILYADTSRRTFKKYGYFISIEPQISGMTWYSYGSLKEKAPEVARYLANMHNIERPYWGRLGLRSFGNRYSLRYIYSRRIREWLTQLHEYSPNFSESTNKCWWEWFRKRARVLDEFDTYSLVHGDPNPGNILITPDNRVYLLDIDRVKYLPFVLDLVIISNKLNFDEWNWFKKYYFDELKCSLQEKIDKSFDFFKGYVTLNSFRHSLRAIKKLPDNHARKSDCQEVLTECWKALEELLDSGSSGF
jgi:Ser/Thr protein kinase RdoA (MazF antagonist)